MKTAFNGYFYIIFIFVFFLGCQGGAFDINTDGSGTGIIEKSGELTQNEVWDGRVHVTGTVIVPLGITLTIRSGSIIGFEPNEEPIGIEVHGELYAEGAPDRMIVFGSLGKSPTIQPSEKTERDEPSALLTSQNLNVSPPKAGDWKGIVVETESPNSRLTYCRIQHAANAIICWTNTVQIERCLFTENNIGILCENASPTISSNEFNRNGNGVQFRGSSAPEVEYNEITANQNGLVCENDSRPRIHHNNIRSNYEYAIICYSTSSPEIVSNNITLNNGWAVYDGGRLRDNYISGNKQVGPNVTELGVSTQSDQFYSVDEVFDPRSTPVSEAGLPRDKF